MGKRRKKPRLRRAYLKRWTYSMINTGSSVNSDLYHELYKNKQLDNNMSLLSILGVQSTEKLIEVAQKVDLICPGIRTRHIVLHNTKFRRVLMFCGAKGGTVMFFEILRGGLIRRSITYLSREIGMERYQTNKICWVEAHQIETTATVNPA